MVHSKANSQSVTRDSMTETPNDKNLNLRQLFSSNNWIILLQQATTFGFVVKTTTMCFSITMHTAKIPATPNRHKT